MRHMRCKARSRVVCMSSRFTLAMTPANIYLLPCAGLLSVPSASASTTYIFTLASDDGSQLYIDGALVVDNGGAHESRDAD